MLGGDRSACRLPMHGWLPGIASAMRGVQDDTADAEASLSTSALIFLLAMWVTRHRHRAVQQRALLVWGLWFEQGLGPEASAGIQLTSPPAELMGLCTAPGAEGGVCGCLRGFLADTAPPPSLISSPQRGLAWSLAKLFTHTVAADCPSGKAWCLRLVAAAADAQECGTEDRSCSDPLTAPHAMMVGPLGTKRRRVDEDLKMAASLNVSRSGAASSSSAWGRATGAAVCSTTQRWGESYLANMRAASLLSFANSERLYLAFDCGRFGNPGEETLVLTIWDGALQRATWLPIQVMLAGRVGFWPNLHWLRAWFVQS